MPTYAFETSKVPSKKVMLIVLGLCTLFHTNQIVHLFESIMAFINYPSWILISANGTLHSGVMSDRSFD